MNVLRYLSTHLVLAASLILPGPALAAADAAASAQAYRRGYDLILDEDWKGAVAAFDDLVAKYPGSDWVDDAAFWSCYARRQAGTPPPEAFACYEKLLARHPKSEWSDDARRAMVRLAKEIDRPEYREKVRDFGQDEDGDRLLAVLVALGEIGDERSVEVILERLDATEDEHLRVRIIDVLEDLESPRVHAKLEETIRTDPSPRVRIAAVDALSESSVDAVALLQEIVKDPGQPSAVRREALDELNDHEPPGLVSFLKEVALDSDESLALEAIDELGDVESEEAVRALAEILKRTPDVGRRIEVLGTLEDFEIDLAVEALLEVARKDPDPRMRRAATESLGDMETPAAREALIRLLQELDE